MRDWRAQTLDSLAGREFDVLVVGGGITGAGIARDAALRGLRVALVEKDDFASGTSSRSSRLIHGGVRYLEHGHLHLVFESSRERRTLQRIAPHLVRPLAFTWPVYRGARVPRWKLYAGLSLYDALALFRNARSHQRLSRGSVLHGEPALRSDGLTGGARYWDAATDDARLTLANALGAARAGATVLNHAALVTLVQSGGAVRGGRVRDALTEREVLVRARCVVSAAGPWTDVLAGDPVVEASRANGVAGAHIAVPRSRVGNRDAVTLLAPQDGRVIFVLPAGDQAIIGTTETLASVRPDAVRATRGEVSYLLEACNAYFPNGGLQAGDVVAAWSGIRPLAAAVTDAGGASGASREHAIAERGLGLLVVTGGKLTTYRAMAEQVVDRVVSSLGARHVAACTSGDVPLPGGDIASLESAEREATEVIGDSAHARRLARAHGSKWRTVWELGVADRALAEPMADGAPYTMAEAVYAIGEEGACTLGDVLIRRTHLAFECGDHGLGAARRLAGMLAFRLGWATEAAERAVGDYEREVERIFSID